MKDSGNLWRGNSLGWTMGVKLGMKGCGGGLDGIEGETTDMERFLEA